MQSQQDGEGSKVKMKEENRVKVTRVDGENLIASAVL